MKRLVAFVTFALMLAGCGPAVEYNYRLAATVDTPEGVKSGSSVIRVTHYKSGGLLKQGSAHFYGEAVPVDLGKRGVLFVLLSAKDYPDAPISLYLSATSTLVDWDRSGGDKAFLDNIRRTKAVTGQHALPRRMYPRFVWFPNLADPKSVQEVDPDNLAATFGDGVQLRGLTVEITNDRRTKGVIEKYLPWTKEIKGGAIDGSPIEVMDNPNLSAHLGMTSFTGEIE